MARFGFYATYFLKSSLENGTRMTRIAEAKHGLKRIKKKKKEFTKQTLFLTNYYSLTFNPI